VIFDGNVKNVAILELVSEAQRKFNVVLNFEHDGKEPTTNLVDSLRVKMKNYEIDSIIGIGGGSTLDLMKALSVLYFDDEPSEMSQGKQLSLTRKLYSIAIPTTAGSGSEATKSAVLTNPNARIKRGVNHLMVLPDVSFLVPALLKGIPDSVFVASIFDGFTHALESFIGRGGTELTKDSASKAIKIYMEQFKLLERSGSLEIHEQILVASNLAGFAICNSETGPVHALSYPLSEFYGVGHGPAIGLLLPEVISQYRESDSALEETIKTVTETNLESLMEILKATYSRYVTSASKIVTPVDLSKLSIRSMELSGAINNSPVPWTLDMSRQVFSKLCLT
jgi:alcohol dehydrogenase class IV